MKTPSAPKRPQHVSLRAADLPVKAAFPGGGGRTAWQIALAIALGPRASSPRKHEAALSLRRLRAPAAKR